MIYSSIEKKELSSSKVLISTADFFGDKVAGYLIDSIQSRGIDFECRGFGGAFMQRAGCNIEDNFRKESFMFVPPVKKLPFILLKFFFKFIPKIQHILDNGKPNLVLLVSGSLINVEIARLATKRKIKVVYMFPPQIWAKRFQRRKVTRILKNSSSIVTTNPIEYKFYKEWKEKLNLQTEILYCEYPFRDLLINKFASPNKVAVKIKNDLYKWNVSNADDTIRIGLFPGSRLREIRGLLPTMIEVARMISEDESIKNNPPQFIVSAATGYLKQVACEIIAQYLAEEQKRFKIKVILDLGHRVIRASHFIITKSGMTTMEALLLAKPMVIVYKVPIIFGSIASVLRNPNEKYVSWPNILYNEEKNDSEKIEVVRELIQSQFTPFALYEAVCALLNKNYRIRQERQLYNIASDFLKNNSSLKISDYLLQFLSPKGQMADSVERELSVLLNRLRSEQIENEEESFINRKKENADVTKLIHMGVKFGFIKNPSYIVKDDFISGLKTKYPRLFDVVKMHSEKLLRIPFLYKGASELDYRYFLSELEARIYHLLSKDELEFDIMAYDIVRHRGNSFLKKRLLATIFALWILNEAVGTKSEKQIIKWDKRTNKVKLEEAEFKEVH